MKESWNFQKHKFKHYFFLNRKGSLAVHPHKVKKNEKCSCNPNLEVNGFIYFGSCNIFSSKIGSFSKGYKNILKK